MKLFPNRTKGFREEDFLRISSYRYSAKSTPPPPPPWRPCFLTDQNFANNFRKRSPKGQSSEIISKSDKWFQRRRNLKNFSQVNTVKKAPPRHVFRQIKIPQSFFEKGHKRNNPVKLFQYRTNSCKGEDF